MILVKKTIQKKTKTLFLVLSTLIVLPVWSFPVTKEKAKTESLVLKNDSSKMKRRISAFALDSAKNNARIERRVEKLKSDSANFEKKSYINRNVIDSNKVSNWKTQQDTAAIKRYEIEKKKMRFENIKPTKEDSLQRRMIIEKRRQEIEMRKSEIEKIKREAEIKKADAEKRKQKAEIKRTEAEKIRQETQSKRTEIKRKKTPLISLL
jgi:hypothetical protein